MRTAYRVESRGRKRGTMSQKRQAIRHAHFLARLRLNKQISVRRVDDKTLVYQVHAHRVAGRIRFVVEEL